MSRDCEQATDLAPRFYPIVEFVSGAMNAAMGAADPTKESRDVTTAKRKLRSSMSTPFTSSACIRADASYKLCRPSLVASI